VNLKANCLFSKTIILICGISWLHASAQTISWSKTGGPYGGSAELLTSGPSGSIFALTSIGMYRSTDTGSSWQALGLNFEYGAAFLVADSVGDVYAGVSTQGLYESTDKGTSWTKSSLTGSANSAALLSGNRLCVGGRQTVSLSDDHGTTWSVSQVTADPRIDVFSLTEDKSGNIYAGLISYHPTHPPGPPFGGGVYVSPDSGKTWDFFGKETTTIASIAFNKEGKVFILEPPTNTTDRGIIWSAAPKSTTWKEDDSGIPYWVKSIQTLFLDNIGEMTAVTDQGIFVYHDSTSSWKSATPAISLSSITSASFDPNGTSYAGTEENGIFLLRNSSSAWVQCGIDPTSVMSIGFDNLKNLFAGTTDGVFEQLPGDDRWLRVSDGLGRANVYQLYFSEESKRLYASTADGLSYLPVEGNYWIPLTKQWTYGFVESPAGDKYTGTNGGIVMSAGDEDIWNTLPTVGLPITTIYCVALDSSKDLFAGTSYNGVFVSTNGGSFWTQTGVSSPFIFSSVMTLAIDNDGRLFAGTDTSGAYSSDDSGVNWNIIPTISGKSVNCFLVNNPAMYFAGTSDAGAFASTDRGLSWFSINNGLTDSSVISLGVDQQGHLLAGTSKGLFASTGIVTRVDEKKKIPSSFSLSQNYPNPFNPTTAIRYQLSVNSNVKLRIYDILGRLVNTLIEERQTAGIHTVTFNANSLSSGIYFYRLEAGNFIEIKKMILIK
jgi:photosystem II stability/assembly factor-like uncharacterized protein